MILIRKYRWVAVLMVCVLLAGCTSGPQQVVTPTGDVTPTGHPTATPTPEAGSEPTGGVENATPEPTAEPSETPTPTASPTPIPTLARDPYNINWWIQEKSEPVYVLSAEDIDLLNQKILTTPGTDMFDMRTPGNWTGQQVYDAIVKYSFPNKAYLDGKALTDSAKNAILKARNPEPLKQAADEKITLRYAVVTSNASLRSFPTSSRISDATGRHDYFQETGLNIGEPLIILYDSADGEWSFVQALTYAGWVKKADFGLCSEAVYMDYTRRRYEKNGSAVVATRNTKVSIKRVQNPGEQPNVSELVYEPYLRLGTTFYTSDKISGSVFEFPVRNADGTLTFISAEVASGPAAGGQTEAGAEAVLILRDNNATIEKILTYAGNLLGEPYSWGDEKQEGMDCSSTLQAIYSMFGLWLPRNGSGQIALPVELKDISALDSAAKTKYISERSAGTILFMPGHVMMLLGEYEGRIYILHNTTVSAKDDGTSTEYYSCVITSMDIGKTGKTLLDRTTLVVNLLERK